MYQQPMKYGTELNQYMLIIFGTPFVAYALGLTLFILAHVVDYIEKNGIISFIVNLPSLVKIL